MWPFTGNASQDTGHKPGVLPDGQRVYAVGDIHGCYGQWMQLLADIQADAQGYAGQVTLMFVGDYADRGPQSREVFSALCQADWPTTWAKIFLRGNHEQALLDFLAMPEQAPDWLHWGGQETLQSYGIGLLDNGRARSPQSLAAELEHVLEESGHKEFIEETQLHYVIGGYLFVHAGVRPYVPLARQVPTDLLFIRRDFIGQPHGLPYRVVFGHTIQKQGHQVLPQPLITPDRIGIDTGAFEGGPLTTVRLEGESVHVLQVAPC